MLIQYCIPNLIQQIKHNGFVDSDFVFDIVFYNFSRILHKQSPKLPSNTKLLTNSKRDLLSITEKYYDE